MKKQTLMVFLFIGCLLVLSEAASGQPASQRPRPLNRLQPPPRPELRPPRRRSGNRRLCNLPCQRPHFPPLRPGVTKAPAPAAFLTPTRWRP